MFKYIKQKLYFLKQWYVIVFTYPSETLSLSESSDYDAYWQQRRGGVNDVRARQISNNEKLRADFIVSIIDKNMEVSIGDIASGPGVIFDYLKAKLNIREYIGYDSSDYALEAAKSLGMKGVKFDINRPDDLLQIKEADYLLLLEILEHIPHSEKVLHEVYKKAQKGVFFSFPNSGNFLYRLRLIFGRMPAQWIKFPNEHLRFWTLTDLTWWLKALGYTNYKIHSYRGIPVLEKLWPSMFAGSFVILLKK